MDEKLKTKLEGLKEGFFDLYFQVSNKDVLWTWISNAIREVRIKAIVDERKRISDIIKDTNM